MKQTFYLLKNNSHSEGTYLIKGEYKTLFPGEEVTLKQRPTNTTANILTSIYKKEVGEVILNLKPKTTKVEKKNSQ